MSFGKILKNLRESKSLTQKELGNSLDISSRVIGYYESGDRFPKDEAKLNEIADFFNVSIDYLLGRHADNTLTNDSIIAFSSLNVDGLDDRDIEAVKAIIESLKEKNKK